MKVYEGKKEVEAITDKSDLKRYLNYYREQAEKAKQKGKERLERTYRRNYFLIILSVNTGLPNSIIRALKVDNFKNYKIVVEAKDISVKLSKEIYLMLMDYIESQKLSGGDYVFRSGKGYNRHLVRAQVYKILQEPKRALNLPYNIGVESLRKTAGYWYYMHTNKDIFLTTAFLMQRDPLFTLDYIGVEKKKEREERENFIIK